LVLFWRAQWSHVVEGERAVSGEVWVESSTKPPGMKPWVTIDTVKVRDRSCKGCTKPSNKAEVSAAPSRPLKPGDISYAPKNTMMMIIIITIYSNQQVSCHEDCSDLVLHDEV